MPRPVLATPVRAAWILLAGTALLLGSCGSLQTRLPDGFAAQSTAFPVTGHSPRRYNEPVRIGPYSALEMHEGSTFSWTHAFGSADMRRTSKPYAFTLVALNLPPVEVQCLTRAVSVGMGPESRRLEIDMTSLDGPMMECGLRMDGMQVRGLQLASKGSRIEGTLDAPWGTRYAVASLSHYDGSKWRSGSPTGYRIGLGDDTLAVVDVVNAGRVHLAASLDEEQRVYFAAAASALLLLEPELGD